MVLSLEHNSEHPLSKAIGTHAEGEGGQVLKVEAFESITGKGVQGLVDGRQVLIGNQRLMEESRVELGEKAKGKLERWSEAGNTTVFVAVAGQLALMLGIKDPVKPESEAAVRTLESMGIEVWMATGDNKGTAMRVAREVGVTHVLADVLPADKLEKVKELQNQGHKVAMVGDGINDSPALAQADVGFAMGTGTDIAMESADVTLVRGEILSLVHALQVSRATMKTVRQNLFSVLFIMAWGFPWPQVCFILSGACCCHQWWRQLQWP